MTDYQKMCAKKAVLAMKGHNRHLAFKWTARAREVGGARKREADCQAHYATREVALV